MNSRNRLFRCWFASSIRRFLSVASLGGSLFPEFAEQEKSSHSFVLCGCVRE